MDNKGKERTRRSADTLGLHVLDNVLGTLADRLPAQLVLLVGASGQVILCKSRQGLQPTNLSLTALGTLVAGDCAANQEIARFIGESQEFQMLVREGQRSRLLYCSAGHDSILLVQIGRRVPLEQARKLVRKASQRLASMPDLQTSAESSPAELGTTLDNLSDLNQAFDNLWTEESHVR